MIPDLTDAFVATGPPRVVDLRPRVIPCGSVVRFRQDVKRNDGQVIPEGTVGVLTHYGAGRASIDDDRGHVLVTMRTPIRLVEPI